MLANAAAPTILASAPPPSMLANAAAPAFLAIAPHPSMLANAGTPTILALAPLPSMLANAAAPAILALVLLPSMLANTAAPAILASALLPSMLAKFLLPPSSFPSQPNLHLHPTSHRPFSRQRRRTRPGTGAFRFLRRTARDGDLQGGRGLGGGCSATQGLAPIVHEGRAEGGGHRREWMLVEMPGMRKDARKKLEGEGVVLRSA